MASTVRKKELADTEDCHFFNISTSKSAPNLSVLCPFDFDMCFAPQRRALFHHLNFQKWSEPGVFCTFLLENLLRATTVCTSTSQLPKVVRCWCALYILLRATMACNFSSVIWPAGSPPATLSLLFDPPEPQIIGTRRRLARERKTRPSSSSEYGSRKKIVGEWLVNLI